ncbi:hypothetical protein C8R46DRAFT_1289908 [Mycena filopes]|nr:hypothetical protein C8R46DRAFT_1289908 [Mycena filopes]
MRLRGGQGSDSEGSDDYAKSDSPAPRKKRKVQSRKQKTSAKGKARARSPSVDPGLRITLGGKNGSPGMFVDEVVDIEVAPECWDVPEFHRVAYILDVSATPDCLQGKGAKTRSVDGHIKKQCQDAWDGGTGSKKTGLAKVTILDEGRIVECRRSNLTCNGFYCCSLADADHLANFERWDSSGSAMHDLVSAPTRAAKVAEANNVVALATAFYRSVLDQHCKTKNDAGFACGGHAVLRKFRTGKSNGKTYFIGCSNWSDDDDLAHRFTKIPREVREPILCQLFKGEEVDAEDMQIIEGPCPQIVHPSHLPKNNRCPRIHYRGNKHVPGQLTARDCPAELLILIPIDETDLRAVITPKSGLPHNHPTFLPSKVPYTAAEKYRTAIDAIGRIGTTTLRVDKAASTKATLGGLLPEEVHPSLINKRKRREMVKDARSERFPEGMGLKAVWNEFEKEKSRAIGDRYIHSVTMRVDMHVIITINADLAGMVHEASWIMVDTTFAVVHGTTNEWKLLIWLNGLDKRTVIGRVWTDRATREAFVLVWNGIFEAVESITGKPVNFKVFSSTSSLLGAIGDSEGAQAQGLGDVIILRRMNTSAVGGIATVTVDAILLFIWKTCLVHFKRGVFALAAHIDDFTFNCLLGFPYLETAEEISDYRAFCERSSNPKVKNWWAHKISYPWLLPSLNRSLTSMSNLHWDLTPGDTNPIEGSHVQDNQVNATNRTLIEAILLAREYDNNTARVIKASLNSGVLENGNNSLQARYAASARRQARGKVKAAERAAADGGKKVKAKLKLAEQESRAKDREIERLRAMLAAGPSTPRRIASQFSQIHRTPPDNLSPVAGPSRLPALNLFPGLPRMSPIADPQLDFDYQMAMRSDILDATLHRIAQSPRDHLESDSQDHILYSIGSDDEILASDPYPTPS